MTALIHLTNAVLIHFSLVKNFSFLFCVPLSPSQYHNYHDKNYDFDCENNTDDNSDNDNDSDNNNDSHNDIDIDNSISNKNNGTTYIDIKINNIIKNTINKKQKLTARREINPYKKYPLHIASGSV